MSRHEEVEASIKWIMSAGMSGGAITPNMRDLARSLADEVDAERAVITKLLAMLDMNTKPRPKHEDFHPFDCDQWNEAVCEWDKNAALYARACEIAGRVK